MTRIAITGHRGLPIPTARLIDQAIRAQLVEYQPDLIGISSIADLADQIFARAILDAGGKLEAIVPAAQYRDNLPEHALNEYDSLIAAASKVDRLNFEESNSEAHMAASMAMLDGADRLFAVWDGQPARGYGGTADVVTEAHKHGLCVTIIWPDGAIRDEPTG